MLFRHNLILKHNSCLPFYYILTHTKDIKYRWLINTREPIAPQNPMRSSLSHPGCLPPPTILLFFRAYSKYHTRSIYVYPKISYFVLLTIKMRCYMYIFWDVSDLYQTHYSQNTHPPSLFSLGFPEISNPIRIL